MRKRYFWEAVATLMGTTIGAGILGIPFAVKEIGFTFGIAFLLGIGLLMFVLNLMLSEVVIRTKKDHELPGFVGHYLGSFARVFTIILLLFASYGGFTAYLIGEGQALSSILGGTPFVWSLVFFAIVVVLSSRGARIVKEVDSFLVGIVALVIVSLTVFNFNLINWDNLVYMRTTEFFSPFGILLFSFTGISAIPQMRKQLTGHERDFPFVIGFSVLAVFVLYSIFVGVVLGITGSATTQVATVGLGHKAGAIMNILGNIIAVITMTTSFITIGYAVQRMFMFDLKLRPWQAVVATFGPPLLIILVGFSSFALALNIVGGLILSIMCILIVLCFWKAHDFGDRVPEYTFGRLYIVGSCMIVIFVLGALVTLGM